MSPGNFRKCSEKGQKFRKGFEQLSFWKVAQESKKIRDIGIDELIRKTGTQTKIFEIFDSRVKFSNLSKISIFLLDDSGKVFVKNDLT